MYIFLSDIRCDAYGFSNIAFKYTKSEDIYKELV